MDWQPIETAPRDGGAHFRGLWVYVNGRYGDYRYWDCYAGYIHDETGEFETLSGDDCGWRAEDFTHWMPLPPPPTEKGGAA